MDSKSFSEGPINFGRKTKKYLFKKVDLAAEIFSFQDFGPKSSLSLMERTLQALPQNLGLLRSQELLGVSRRPIAQNDRTGANQNQFAIVRLFHSCQFAYSNF